MIERIFRNFALLGGFGLLLLLALTVAAVVMRKVFGTPLLGVFDISQMTLIVIVFSGLAYCGITRGHVAVDLFSDFFPPTIQKVLNVVINMVTAALLSMMAWFTAIRAFESRELNEATMMIFIPHYPFFLIAALGFALFAIASFMLATGYSAKPPDKTD